MIARELVAELAALGPIREDELLSRHTTFGIGGPADAYLVAGSPEALAGALALCHRYQTPFFVLGSGSNILVGDLGIRGVVIENHATQVEGPRPDGDGALLEAASGVSLAALARSMARQGWAGLEWAGGIPGTVGGAVVYNAGAYGGCLADILLSVRIAYSNGEHDVPAADLELVYRGSAFTRGLLENKAVLSATFRLQRGDAAQLVERVSELDRRRLAAQPRGRNAGSIFKNAPEHPAWWLIDQVGLKGHRFGEAVISPTHANFFINASHARAANVKALIDLARERVMARFGIELELEVALVGEGF
jgi:UDP-N-acetylmuramate dehydrogenase